MSNRPDTAEYAPYFERYVSLVPESSILEVLEDQIALVRSLPDIVASDLETGSYDPGKWTIREVTGHLIDGERVFGYRAYRISRGDTTPMAGFDQDVYVANAPYRNTPLRDLVTEFVLVRDANLVMLRSLDATSWGSMGTANRTEVSVRALAYIMAGHVRHHLRILSERYGVTV